MRRMVFQKSIPYPEIMPQVIIWPSKCKMEVINIQKFQKFLRLKEVLTIIPVSKNTFLAGLNSGRFKVTPIRNGRCVFYLQSEIEDLVQQIIAESTAGSKTKAA